MSVEIAPSESAVTKPAKRRKKIKKPPSSREDLERKKTLANIVHKKVTSSSNWQQFTANKMHLQKHEEPVDNKEKAKSFYKGQFRKHRKIKPTVEISSNPPTISETSSDPASSSLATFPITNTIMKAGQKNDVKLTRFIGIDCEMVGVDDDGKDNMLARVSLVNKHGDCIYDKFVKPKEDVADYRTHVSGVRPKDLENAESFETVQKEVAEIITGRILVGHALRNDLKVLYLGHPRRNIRDTSKYDRFRKLNKGRTPSLKKLAAEVLGVTIQDGEHNSVIDARATMQLYNMYSKEWEADRQKKLHKSKQTTKKKFKHKPARNN